MAQKIAVILPTLNEATAIGRVIDEIRALQMGCCIVVADSSSTDETVAIALDKGVCVLPCSKGKGKAIREALNIVIADYIFILDADYTYPAVFIIPMHHVLESGFDAVAGIRKHWGQGAMGKSHRIGNRLLTWEANILYKQKTSDLCTGMWGFRRHTAKFLAKNLVSDGFTLESEIFTTLARNGHRVYEVPIMYRKRIGDGTKLKMRNGFKIAKFLLDRRVKVPRRIDNG